MKPQIKLTPSRVRDYLSCPLKFSRLYRPPEEYRNEVVGNRSQERQQAETKGMDTVFSFSNSIHAVLDALHRPIERDVLDAIAPCSKVTRDLWKFTLTDEALTRIVSEHWQPKGYDDRGSEESAFLQACDILRFYCQSEHTPRGEVLGTEAYLSVVTTIGGFTVELSGRLDRLELRDDGTLEVLDYKLTKDGALPSVGALAGDLASFLYFLLTWHHYRQHPAVRNVRISQLNLLSLKKVEVQYDQRQILQHRTALTELVMNTMHGEMEPRPHHGCAWCPVRESCPAWAEMDMNELDKFEAWLNREGREGED
jgi:RecB family exonuclease